MAFSGIVVAHRHSSEHVISVLPPPHIVWLQVPVTDTLHSKTTTKKAWCDCDATRFLVSNTLQLGSPLDP